MALLLLARSMPAQWVAQASNTDRELRGLSVRSAYEVWASGMRGSVVHTADGGSTWMRDTVPGASSLDLRAIAATSALTAHAISIADSSRIYRTTDGGRTWSIRFAATRKGTFFDAIRFWDTRHGITMSDPVDGKFLLMITGDGGDTWQEVPPAALPRALPNEGAFAASGSCLETYGANDVWFVTGGASVARIYHSGDRGRTWTASDTPIRAGVAAAGVFSVAFRDAMHGVISGGDYQKPTLRGRNLALTSDGGRTWTVVDSASSPAGYRSAVTFVPGSDGLHLVSVGLSGTDVSVDGGRTWRLVDSTAYNSVQFVAAGKGSTGYAVGPKGRISKWTSPLSSTP